MNKVVIKQAVILAGGAGTRLRPFTLSNPKPMYPINEKPFLEHLIKLLKENGVREIVVLTGYLGDKISNYFGDGSKFGIKIIYSHTPYLNAQGVENLNGLRLKNAIGLLENHFLLMYCDNYWPVNLKKIVAAYNQNKTLAMMAVYANKYGLGEYGFENNIFINKDNLITKYDKSRNETYNGLDIGTFIINKTIFKKIKKKNFSFEIEILPRLIKEKELSAFVTDHRYYFITNTVTAKNMSRFLKPKKIIFLDCGVFTNEKFEFLPNSIKALQLLIRNNYQIYIITNQNIYHTSNEHHIDLTRTIYIGSDRTGLIAGQNAGCQTLLVTKSNSLLEVVKSVIKK
jgi:D-glycero-D-manno-heptose 1,7-bisphosphate phosphatase